MMPNKRSARNVKDPDQFSSKLCKKANGGRQAFGT